MTSETLGSDLRALRKTRGMTLEALSKASDKSVGWLSQIERGLTVPRVSDLQTIARILKVPMSLFLGPLDAPEQELGLIVRAHARREIGQRVAGLVETLISPDLTDSFEVIHSVFEAGASRESEVQRPTQELAFLISGQLDVLIENTRFVINTGDSFRIKGQKYRWSNPYENPATAIWVISPPVY